MSKDQKKPDIDYPCAWQYKIIGKDKALLEQAISQVCGDLQYTVAFSNSSSSGKYFSLNVETEVSNEEQRNLLFTGFQNNPHVTMVI